MAALDNEIFILLRIPDKSAAHIVANRSKPKGVGEVVSERVKDFSVTPCASMYLPNHFENELSPVVVVQSCRIFPSGVALDATGTSHFYKCFNMPSYY